MKHAVSKNDNFKRRISIFEKETEKFVKYIDLEIPAEDTIQLRKQFDEPIEAVTIEEDPDVIFCYEIKMKHIPFLSKYTDYKLNLEKFIYYIETYSDNS